MMASCGPALRNSLANIIIRNISARTISAAITNTWFSIKWTVSSLAPSGLPQRVAREFIPRAHVGNSLLVAGYDYFGALRNGRSGFGPRARYAARAALGIDQLAD